MKIRYITSHGVAERVEFDAYERDILTISVEPYHNGAVVLADKFFTLADGVAEIPMRSLPDGEYTPRIESEDGIFIAESFTKSGMSIAVKEADEKLIRRMLERCHALENELYSLKKRTEKLEDVCSGHNIFDFERKEK